MADDTSSLGVDVRDFVRGINRAVGSLGNLGAALGIGAITAFIGGIVSSAGALVDQASAINLNVEAIQELNYAFGQSGASADDVTASLFRLSGAIQDASEGGDKVNRAFAELGITTRDLKELSLDKVIEKIADGLRDAEDYGKATDAVLELLGKTGKKLIPSLREGAEGIRELRNEASKLTTEEANKLDRAGDAWAAFFKAIETSAQKSVAKVVTLIDRIKELYGLIPGGARSGLEGGVKAGSDFALSAINPLANLKKIVGAVSELLNPKDKEVFGPHEYFGPPAPQDNKQWHDIAELSERQSLSAQAEERAREHMSELINRQTLDEQAANKAEEKHLSETEKKRLADIDNAFDLADAKRKSLQEEIEHNNTIMQQRDALLKMQKEESKLRAKELETENKIQSFRDKGDNIAADELANRKAASDERTRMREAGAGAKELAEADKKEAANQDKILERLGRETAADRKAQRETQRENARFRDRGKNRDKDLEARSKIDQEYDPKTKTYKPKKGRSDEVDRFLDRQEAAKANAKNEADKAKEPKSTPWTAQDSANLAAIKQNLTPDA